MRFIIQKRSILMEIMVHKKLRNTNPFLKFCISVYIILSNHLLSTVKQQLRPAQISQVCKYNFV